MTRYVDECPLCTYPLLWEARRSVTCRKCGRHYTGRFEIGLMLLSVAILASAALLGLYGFGVLHL